MAQTLDIRPTEAPAGAGIAVADARADLQDELEAIDQEGGTAPGASARAALRRYALLTLPAPGEPEPPASLPLLGRTLWRLAPELDAAVEGASASAAEHMVLMLARAPAPLSAAEAELTLRDALAPVMQQSEGPVGGWFDSLAAARPGGELAAPLTEAWLEGAGASPAVSEELAAVEALLEEADQWRAYRRSAAAIRSGVRLGAAALSIDEVWVEAVTKAALADAWADASRRLADERQDAALQLDLLAGVSAARRLLDIAGSLEGGRWDRTRAAVDTAVAHDPTLRARRLHEAAEILAQVAGVAAPGAATERDVIRQLRPAWRALESQREQAMDDLAAVAPDLLAGGRVVSDPGALAALATFVQASQDMEHLQLISALIADPAIPEEREPQAHRDYRLAASRLLRHGQALQSGDGAAAALQELREFGGRLRARRGEPDVEWLGRQQGAVAQAWQAMAGGRAAELLAVDADVMGTWLRLWPDTNDATRLRELQQRMQAHESLLPLLRDLGIALAIGLEGGATAEDPAEALRTASPGLAPRWPGWELSPVAFDALLARSETRIAEAVAIALDRRGDAPVSRAAAAADDLAPLRLLVRVEEALAAHEPAPGAALDEIALGPPLPGSLLGSARDALAAAALAIEDWALAPEADEALWARAVTLSRAALREAF